MPSSFEIDLIPIPSAVVPSQETFVQGSASLLPLDTFRQIIGVNPFHFNGLVTDSSGAAPLTSNCNAIVGENSYQMGGAAGRQEMREAIETAEKKLTDYLQYSPAPRYKEFVVPYTRYYDQRVWHISPVDAWAGWISVMLPEGYIQGVGTLTSTLLDTPAVIYSDAYGLNINDTFTVQVNTEETDPANLRVYLAQADRLDNSLERWRIQPVQISISGGIATITGKSWLLVNPSKYIGYKVNPNGLDANDATNFVTTLDVYSVKLNEDGQTLATAQGLFEWDALPYPTWAWLCNVDNVRSTDPTTVAQALVRVGERDARLGIVIPGRVAFNGTAWEAIPPYFCQNCRPPQRVVIRTNAGFPLDDQNRMDKRLARAVAYLAIAELPEKICACDDVNKVLWRYQTELNRTSRDLGTETWAVSRDMLNNPFGQRRGHLYAYREVQRLRLERGVSAP